MLRCLAGVQAGVLGGVTMLLYFSVDAMLRRQRWTSPEVLLGSVVYGNWAIWSGSFRAILAGVGFQIFLAGLAGILFALLVGGVRMLQQSRAVALAAAVAFSFAWCAFCYLLLFPRIAPLIPIYTSRSVAIAAHALLGLMLSQIPAIHSELTSLADIASPPDKTPDAIPRSAQ